MNIFNQTRRIWIAGHTGMLGASLAKKLVGRGENVITVNSDKLDLRDESATFEWVRRNKPEIVFVAAAKVGGILANIRQPVPFLLDNLRIQSNVMAACAESGVEKLVFFGSSCMYPREAFQPFREVDIDSGSPELSNL